LLAGFEFENIQTYIQSGNVVFQSNKLNTEKAAVEVSTAIERAHGFEPRVLLISAEALAQAIAQNPFPTDDGKILHFYFLATKAVSPNTERLDALKLDSEQYAIIDHVFYLYTPEGFGRSKLAAGAEKALNVPVTARNWNTVDKLQQMVSS
jgi:uncharacterized protein (DUF1697 family)